MNFIKCLTQTLAGFFAEFFQTIRGFSAEFTQTIAGFFRAL